MSNLTATSNDFPESVVTVAFEPGLSFSGSERVKSSSPDRPRESAF